MYLFKAMFERHKGDQIIESSEYFCADSFSQVYEKVKTQDDENYELVEIKRLVPVLGVIKSKEKEEDSED